MGTIDIDLKIRHHFSSGLYAKQMFLPAQHFAVTHAHEYDHFSILASWRVTVTVDDVPTEYVGPACIEIKAGEHHTIVAHEDAVWFCIHATDVADPDIVDEVLIRRK